MGNNYYVKESETEKRHIGKASAGHNFLFSTDMGLSVQEIKRALRYSGMIVDEYGTRYSSSEMITIMTHRKEGNGRHWDTATYLDDEQYPFVTGEFI